MLHIHVKIKHFAGFSIKPKTVYWCKTVPAGGERLQSEPQTELIARHVILERKPCVPDASKHNSDWTTWAGKLVFGSADRQHISWAVPTAPQGVECSPSLAPHINSFNHQDWLYCQREAFSLSFGCKICHCSQQNDAVLEFRGESCDSRLKKTRFRSKWTLARPN